MNTRLLSLLGLLLILSQAFAETTPMPGPAASRPAVATATSTAIASSLNPSTVGAGVTFTAMVKDVGAIFTTPLIVNEGTVTFSEGATVLATVSVVAGVASFNTSALTVGTHVILATYDGTANFSTSTGSIAQTVDSTDPCPTYAGNIAYVNASATPGTNDGTTWANAFLTLQGALDAARTCGVTQIWVAQGTYVPTTYPIGAATGQFSGALTSADFSFHLVNGVAIYGGFSGSETQLNQRNWIQNPTLLSGSNARNHVVTSANDGLTTRLDGFTITGGRAGGNTLFTVEGLFFGATNGAGMALQNSSLTLNNLLISGNSCPASDNSGGSGAGMQMQGGSSVLTNVAFVGNSAYAGGGLSASSTSFTMTNGVFSGNTANAGGGGMIVSSSSRTLTNVVFANNAATRASSSNGGAILNNSGVTTLINCTFFGNTAGGTGGTMYSVNGATVTDKNGIYYNNSNNGNTAYNGVLNFTPSFDSFTATTTLTGTDPKFIDATDPDGPDNRWMTADDGLALQSTSPAINAGTAAGAPLTDILGAARVGNPDQGAYEYNPCVIPTAFTVTGGGSYCAGSGGVAIGLSGSESGVSYQLKDANGNVAAAVPGTGNALSFGNQPAAGTYTVVATNTTTSCTATMTGSVSVTVNPNPTTFAITGGGGYCAGGSGVAIGLSGSQSGVSYQLKDANGNVGAAVPGTGNALSFGNQPAAGTYTVVATNTTTSCTASMTGTATVTVNPNPTAFAITGGGGYCAGGSGVAIGLSGSQSGVSYQLKDANGNMGAAVPGTGNALSFGNQPAAGTYTVVATNTTTSCTAPMTGSMSVTVNPLPTAYAMSGGGAYCVGGSGVAIGLSGSESGVSYQLKDANGNVGAAVPGTGNALSFGNQTAAGTYTVVATNTTTSCTAPMTGSATVTVNVLPIVTPGSNQSVVFGFGSNCTNISATATGAATLGYSWNNGAGNGATVNVCPQTTTTYTVTVTDGNGCQATAQVTVNVKDVRCGNKNQNVTICYYGVTQCVSEKIAARYLKLGATLGGCGTGNARLGAEESSELPLSLSLKAYPNPVQDAVTVEVLAPNAGRGTFEVLDLTGRVRQSRQEELVEGLNEVEFRLGSLPTGIYLIRAVDALNHQGVVRVSKE